MQIQGSHHIQATRDQVWALLNDPDVLARCCAPGGAALEAEGPDQFKATVRVAVGPVKGTFQGHIRITEKTPPEAMTLTLIARSGVGGVSANGRIRLEEDDGGTRVVWSGEPQLLGMLASLGGRLLQGVAQAQAEEFFRRLEAEIVASDT